MPRPCTSTSSWRRTGSRPRGTVASGPHALAQPDDPGPGPGLRPAAEPVSLPFHRPVEGVRPCEECMGGALELQVRLQQGEGADDLGLLVVEPEGCAVKYMHQSVCT